MRLHRFYTTEKLSANISYTNSEHLHQWRNVFRYSAGDSIILFGDDFEHEYIIESLDKKQASLKEISKKSSTLQDRELTLALAIIKKENFELVLEKCTEIGVTKFMPIVSERSIQKVFNTDRLKKILIEATEQSGWGRVPELLEVSQLTEILSPKIIVLDQTGQSVLPSQVETILIGPEGGWSESELAQFKSAGSKLWSLKTGVLRAETAAILASGIIKNTP